MENLQEFYNFALYSKKDFNKHLNNEERYASEAV